MVRKDVPDNKDIKSIIGKITSCYSDDSNINIVDLSILPSRSKIVEILNLLMELLIPGYTGK